MLSRIVKKKKNAPRRDERTQKKTEEDVKKKDKKVFFLRFLSVDETEDIGQGEEKRKKKTPQCASHRAASPSPVLSYCWTLALSFV